MSERQNYEMTQEDAVPRIGVEEGDVCNRDGCDGRIEAKPPENCSCHINPPCTPCIEAGLICPECDWQSSEE